MQVCQVSAVSEKNYEFFVVENFPSMSPRQIKRFFNFPFSNLKSMLTLGCYSNQRYYPTRIRNTTYIEAIVISMYDKFQLHTPFGL